MCAVESKIKFRSLFRQYGYPSIDIVFSALRFSVNHIIFELNYGTQLMSSKFHEWKETSIHLNPFNYENLQPENSLKVPANLHAIAAI